MGVSYQSIFKESIIQTVYYVFIDFSWLWSEAGSQPKLEESIGMEPGFMYPVISSLKQI